VTRLDDLLLWLAAGCVALILFEVIG